MADAAAGHSLPMSSYLTQRRHTCLQRQHVLQRLAPQTITTRNSIVLVKLYAMNVVSAVWVGQQT